jgi:hypothetical protein
MKKILSVAFGGLVAVALFLPSVAGAAEFIKPAHKNDNVVLGTTETHKNLYTIGGTVTVNSTIQGDIVAAAGTITMDGPVEGDVLVMGGTVTINNTIGGDVRVAGGTVTINAQVGGDVLALGGTIILSEKSQVGGDVTAAGGTLTLNAPVLGKVWVCGGAVTINSKVDGPVVVKRSDTVTFGPKAQVAGAIKIQAKNDPVVQEGAQIASIDFQRMEHRAGYAKGIVLGIVISLLASILVALVFAWVAPRRLEGLVAQVKGRFWVNAGIGVATLIVTPIVAVILFVIGVGFQIGLILMFGYLFAVAIAWVVGMLWTGSWVYQLLTKSATLVINWKTAVLGAVVFVLIKFIPVVGALFCFIVMLAAFGQILTNVKRAIVERGEVRE